MNDNDIGDALKQSAIDKCDVFEKKLSNGAGRDLEEVAKGVAHLCLCMGLVLRKKVVTPSDCELVHAKLVSDYDRRTADMGRSFVTEDRLKEALTTERTRQNEWARTGRWLVLVAGGIFTFLKVASMLLTK